jgi:peptidoglycan/LPS O-acetylase OafA/YrhL
MNRRYDFDWLRALGAGMVVVAHCDWRSSPSSSTGGSRASSLD